MLTPLLMLALLALPWLILRPIPGLRERPSLRGSLGMTLVFLFTGVGHFIVTDQMAKMIPPVIPYRREVILASGVVEILVGLALVPRRTRMAAGWLSIAMLAALLPFNVYAALERIPFGGHEWGPVYLLVRVPVQIALAVWCWWFAIRQAGETAPNAVAATGNPGG
jgi:uncharacterized membrane protein